MACKLRSPKNMFRVFWNETSSFWGVVSCLAFGFGLIVGSANLITWIEEGLDSLLLKALAVCSGIFWALVLGLFAWILLVCAWQLVKKVMCEDKEDENVS